MKRKRKLAKGVKGESGEIMAAIALWRQPYQRERKYRNEMAINGNGESGRRRGEAGVNVGGGRISNEMKMKKRRWREISAAKVNSGGSVKENGGEAYNQRLA
jgi:hypothetical protein